jgi:DNA-binding NarL/FixJ family response regulator
LQAADGGAERRIRVAIVDDQALVREGIRLLLARQGDLEVVGEGESGFDAVALARSCRPHLLLLELPLPGKDGLDATREIAALGVRTRVLIVTRLSGAHFCLRTLRAGASGYLRKQSGSAELLAAIREIHRGRIYLPPDLQDLLLARCARPGFGEGPEERLSDREVQVLTFLASGLTNREIGARLFISAKTVDTHRANLLQKLGLRNNADLTRFALAHGLVD